MQLLKFDVFFVSSYRSPLGLTKKTRQKTPKWPRDLWRPATRSVPLPLRAIVKGVADHQDLLEQIKTALAGLLYR